MYESTLLDQALLVTLRRYQTLKEKKKKNPTETAELKTIEERLENPIDLERRITSYLASLRNIERMKDSKKISLDIIAVGARMLLSNWAENSRQANDNTLGREKNQFEEKIGDLFSELMHLPKAIRKTIDFSHLNLSKIILKKLDLRFYDFHGSNFDGSDLSGSTIKQSNLEKISIKNMMAKNLIYSPDTSRDIFVKSANKKAMINSSENLIEILNLSENTNEIIANCIFIDEMFLKFPRNKFKDCIFIDCQFPSIILSDAQFENCVFNKCSMSGANFAETEFKACEFNACIFSQANMFQTIFDDKCTFVNPVCFGLKNTSLTLMDRFKDAGAVFDIEELHQKIQASFPIVPKYTLLRLNTTAKPPVITFASKHLKNIDFSDATFTGVIFDLTDCEITDCNFANFKGHLNCRGAKIKNCNFYHAELGKESDFTQSIIEKTSFYNAYLLNCDLSGALISDDVDFENATLGQAPLLTDEQVLKLSSFHKECFDKRRLQLKKMLTANSRPQLSFYITYLLHMHFSDKHESVFDGIKMSVFNANEFKQIVETIGKDEYMLEGCIIDRKFLQTTVKALNFKKRKAAQTPVLFKNNFQKMDLRQVFGFEKDTADTSSKRKKTQSLGFTIDLSNTYISYANCKNVYVANCSLAGADAKFADFSGADFSEIYPELVKGCDFRNANFTGVRWGKNNKAIKILNEHALVSPGFADNSQQSSAPQNTGPQFWQNGLPSSSLKEEVKINNSDFSFSQEEEQGGEKMQM